MSHQFHTTVLREYDIRGIIGETLGTADAYAIGRGFATLLRQAGGSKVAVGYDGRLSSPELEAALVEGLNDSGCDAVRIGMGPMALIWAAVRGPSVAVAVACRARICTCARARARVRVCARARARACVRAWARARARVRSRARA